METENKPKKGKVVPKAKSEKSKTKSKSKELNDKGGLDKGFIVKWF